MEPPAALQRCDAQRIFARGDRRLLRCGLAIARLRLAVAVRGRVRVHCAGADDVLSAP